MQRGNEKILPRGSGLMISVTAANAPEYQVMRHSPQSVEPFHHCDASVESSILLGRFEFEPEHE